LPSVVSNGINLSFVYDATGRKLRETSAAGTVNYVDGIQYKPNGTIDFIQTGEGVARSNAGTSYSYEYNLADHLGNNRVTYYKNPSNNQVEVLQRDNYYAFGLRKVALAGNNKYLYNGKELQSELGLYDYGARFYDPVIGRWNVVDPKAELLEMSSPYVYSLNSPVNFIDKDGELPIYINGNTSSDSERGDRSYWDAQLLRTIARSGMPNPGGQIHLVDGNRGRQAINGKYYVTNDRATGATDRFLGGQMEAKKDFSKILSMLERDPKTNKVIEKIQIYTHSRGGAFGAGYTDALLELIKNNADQFANPNNVIDYVLNLAPHQSNSIDASDGANSFSIDHTWDMLSGDDMGNNTGFQTNTKSGSLGASHQNKTFTNEVGSFIKAYQGSKGDNNKLIDDFTKRMRADGITVTVN
jgi:RHS repeat-associated protein